jgi:hypothetical protein
MEVKFSPSQALPANQFEIARQIRLCAQQICNGAQPFGGMIEPKSVK